MEIAAVDVFQVRIPLERPYVFGRGSVDAFDNLIVRIRTRCGAEGYGECAIKSLRTDITAARRIVEQEFVPKLIGVDPRDLESTVNSLLPYAGPDLATLGAVDTALWDLVGRSEGLPVHKLCGGLFSRTIPVDYTLAIAQPEEMGQAARAKVDLGYRTLVVKTGLSAIAEDTARVAAVREAVGGDIRLRVDANASYTVDDALLFFDSIESYDIEFVEQPIRAGDVGGLKWLAERSGVPICIDEGLVTLADAIELAKSAAVAVFNIKIPQCGGIYLCKKISAVAEAAEIPCILGGRLALEIIRQAGRHFVASTAIACTGLAHTGAGPASQALTSNIAEEVVSYRDVAASRGAVSVTDKAGLGVTVDELALARFSI